MSLESWNRRLRARALLMVMPLILAALPGTVGCEDDKGGGGTGTWLHHQGGVVCKGRDAVMVSGSDIWVSPSGDDANPGDSVDAPFATLAQALCNAAPGQTVRVGLGTYNESVILSEFGDATNPIYIVGEVGAASEIPLLDGGGSLTYGIAIVGEDDSTRSGGFVIEGLELKGYTDAGLIAVIADNITVRDLVVHGNGFHSTNPDNAGEGFGLDFVEVNTLLVERVDVFDNGPEPAIVLQGIMGDGVTVWGSVDVVVRDSTCDGNIGGGVLIEDSQSVLVENNLLTNTELDANGEYWGGAIWLDGGHNVIVRGNTITNNLGPGVVVSDEGVQNPTGYVLENNVITGNFWGIYVWNFGICPWPDPSILTLSGNTIENNTTDDFWCNDWECGVGQLCD